MTERMRADYVLLLLMIILSLMDIQLARALSPFPFPNF